MISARALLILGSTALFLAGCGDVREDLGLGRNPPDAFAVVDRAPLSMPPDFSLRPPEPGAPRPQAINPTDQASEALFNAAPAGAASESGAEQALLSAAGATDANPSIRAEVNRESAQQTEASPHLVQRLLDWGGGDKQPGTAVDAPAEAARIKQDEQQNKPLDEGATPVIEKGDQSGWLGL